MEAAAWRDDEAAALAALQSLEVLDSEAEAAFDALARVASAVCGAPISLISLVDAHRQWFKANIGLEGVRETPRELAFCAHAVLGDELFEVPDAEADPRFAGNPLVTGWPDIRFYAGMPLHADGHRIGTLCVIDRRPRQLDDAQRETLRQLALAAEQALAGRRAIRATSRLLAQHAESERVLAQERRRLADIIEATRSGTWEWHAQTGELRLNERSAAIIGHTLAELGSTTTMALREQLTHPEDLPRAREQMLRHLRGEEADYRIVTRVRHRDGHWVWLQEHGRTMTRSADGRAEWVVGTHRDISGEMAAQAEAQRNAQLLRAAIDALDEAFVLYDPDDRLVLCNDKYRAVYPTSADLLVPGNRFEDIVREGARRGQYPAAIGRVEEWVAERMAAHRSGNTTLIQQIDDGRTLRIVERRMPDGHLVGFRIDITDLVAATARAESASQAKSEFIATVSHELRTPLTSIIGFAELGEHFALQEKAPRLQGLYERISAAGARMLTLVNELLDLSENAIGRQSLQLRRTDLGHLAGEVAAELQPQAERRALRLQGLDALPPLPLNGDASRLQQVLRNVLANALRFAPAGSAIDLAARSGAAAGGGVELTVTDDGPGIPDDELESIFEPFVQSSRTRDGSGGSGLGLAICRRIMAAHGGRIDAANAPGRGAVLRLWLPG